MVPGMKKNLDTFLALGLPENVQVKLLQDNADRLFGPAPPLGS
jgi:predicted TIM-barrel fold metal-dependent hydrolase